MFMAAMRFDLGEDVNALRDSVHRCSALVVFLMDVRLGSNQCCNALCISTIHYTPPQVSSSY